jgi:teichuronic acid biosynthesis glycosyltransferase TuaG
VSVIDLDPTLVSVITPIYNSEATILETVRSVCAQSYRDWEMLCLIDEGTRDKSDSIVRGISRTDPRVRLVDVPGGRSVSDARNYGMSVARGRYLAFLDSDDLWLPDKLLRQIGDLRQRRLQLSFTGYRRLSQDGLNLGRQISVPESVDYDQLLAENVIACLTAMIDRGGEVPLGAEALVMRDIIGEDYLFWLGLLKLGVRAGGLNEDLARYRIVEGSRSSKKTRGAAARWSIYRDHEQLSLPKSLWAFSRYVVRTGIKHLRY